MEIRILHVSDLHVTAPGETLAGAWNTAAEVAGDGYDFIVVSGDLTQAASPAEYEERLHFVETLLLPHLARPDRRRMIIVPGNHDVSWDECTRLSTARGPADVRADPELARFLTHPELSSLRMRIRTDDPSLELVSYDRRRYNQRFAGFQSFVDRFYGPAPEGHRNFACTGPDEDHWSAHVFPEEKIAFYGLSSCLGNDRHWTGAAIGTKSLDHVRQHMNKYASGCLPIAVWHHGLTSGRGASDFIGVAEVGRLKALGFRIGLHGHTHVDEFRHFSDTFRSSMPILAVGSLGADAAERPGGVANQFASISLFSRRYLEQRIFEWKSGLWGLTQTRMFDVEEQPAVGPSMPRMGSHRRCVSVDEGDGVATVCVELRDARLTRELRLAAPTVSPSRRLKWDPATTGDPPLAVEERMAAGRPAYFVPGAGEIRRLVWNYQVANSFAIYPYDVRFWQSQKLDGFGLRADEDGFGHEVSAIARELVLELQFTNGSQPAAWLERIKSVRVRVESRPGQHGNWSMGLEEERSSEALTAAIVPAGSAFRATIPEPIVGRRYSLVYQFERCSDDGLDAGLSAAREVLRLTRDRAPVAREADRELGRELTRKLAEVLRSSTADGGAKPLPFVVYLWDRDRSSLLPSFGTFPPRTWGSTFEYGQGVVGHAFRSRIPVTWTPQSNSLYYAPPAQVQSAREPNWIVALPLLLSPKGPPIGVLALTDYGLGAGVAAAARAIELLAHNASAQNTRVEAQASLAAITEQFTRALWLLLKRKLPRQLAGVAEEAARSWSSPGKAKRRPKGG